MEIKKVAVLIDQCKPEYVDARKLVKEYNRVFLGYPLIKKDMDVVGSVNEASYNLDDLVFDSGVATYNEHQLRQNGRPIKKQLAKYINQKYRSRSGSLIKIISEINELLNDGYTVYALIYRPPFTYVGIINNWEFKDPKKIKYKGKSLLEAYKEMWSDEKWGRNLASHIAHMALAFKIKEGTLRQVSPILPLSKIMMRPQAKLIKDNKDKECKKFCEWIDNVYNKKEVQPCLEESVTSTGLEVLCCELLNLEYKKQKWFHSGGMGDLGVDGFGMQNNNIVGVLQCKRNIDKEKLDELRNSIKKYIASLKPPTQPKIYIGTLSKISNKKKNNDCIILDLAEISKLVEKHKEILSHTWKWLGK